MKKSVIIFGAGIAGLSAAHYLIDRGYSVTVIESLEASGGLARSERVLHDNGMPSEYSWRGFGPWYHNTFSLMKEIPIYTDKKISNVYTEELSNPINFILTPDTLEKYNHQIRNFESLFRISTLDKLKLGWLALSTVSACKRRSENDYALTNAKQVLDKYLSAEGAKTVSSVFGPWVGTDYTRASMHHVAAFFRRNIFPGPPAPYSHPYSNPPFTQGGWSGWLILRQPSNESWFDPWTRYLQERGVKFQFNTKLDRLCWDSASNKISSAEIVYSNCNAPRSTTGDYYVLAINPYITNDILMKTPDIVAADKQLQLFSPLVSDSPHKQISFRIAFPEKIHLPGKETAVILVDSEYDITLFSQDQLWKDDTYLGNNVKSLWSGTATVDSVPGKLYGMPMKYLTREQFIDEIKYQICRSKSLDALVMTANNGRHLSSFPIERIEVWHSWIFPEQNDGTEIRDTYPKWVNNSRNFPYQPTAKTSIPNLFLAGAHTRTFADLYSMEAAVESGRRVADIISNQNTVLPQTMPPFLLPLQKIDCILYSIGLPNIIHMIPVILGIILMYLYLRRFKLQGN